MITSGEISKIIVAAIATDLMVRAFRSHKIPTITSECIINARNEETEHPEIK